MLEDGLRYVNGVATNTLRVELLTLLNKSFGDMTPGTVVNKYATEGERRRKKDFLQLHLFQSFVMFEQKMVQVLIQLM